MGVIPRERFCEIMNQFIACRETSDKIDKMISADSIMKDTRDFFSATSLHMANEPIVVELLAYMFDDTGEVIEYWMYEMDFGRAWHDGAMWDENGEDVDLSDAGKLYDYLVENVRI